MLFMFSGFCFPASFLIYLFTKPVYSARVKNRFHRYFAVFERGFAKRVSVFARCRHVAPPPVYCVGGIIHHGKLLSPR